MSPSMTRGQNGVAVSFLAGSFTPYNMPVYPGALRLNRHFVNIVDECIRDYAVSDAKARLIHTAESGALKAANSNSVIA